MINENLHIYRNLISISSYGEIELSKNFPSGYDFISNIFELDEFSSMPTSFIYLNIKKATFFLECKIVS